MPRPQFAGMFHLFLWEEDLLLIFFSLLGLSTIGIDMLRIRRIRRRMEFVTRDDQLLMQHPVSLSHRELQEALRERGM